MRQKKRNERAEDEWRVDFALSPPQLKDRHEGRKKEGGDGEMKTRLGVHVLSPMPLLGDPLN